MLQFAVMQYAAVVARLSASEISSFFFQQTSLCIQNIRDNRVDTGFEMENGFPSECDFKLASNGELNLITDQSVKGLRKKID